MIFSKNLRNWHLHWQKLNLGVFWQKRNWMSSGWDITHSFLSPIFTFLFGVHIKTHYSVFHCHVKRNQEPVDISHFKHFHLVLAFSHFHVLTFQHFSPSAPANLIIYCDPLASSRAQLYNQPNLCRLKSCSTKHTCSTLAVINKLF